jgi:hypothetical protein
MTGRVGKNFPLLRQDFLPLMQPNVFNNIKTLQDMLPKEARFFSGIRLAVVKVRRGQQIC